jgi:nucleotide-binding universal stress UspA family protein
MKAILVAVDIERRNGDVLALARAVQLASVHAAKLMILHVLDSRYAPLLKLVPSPRKTVGEELIQAANERLQSLLSARSICKRSCEPRVAIGVPYRVVTRIAEQSGADLIVIGGRPPREKPLGSTAERIIRIAKRPVLVVKRPATLAYGQVVLAVDFSAQSKAAAVAAIRLAPEAGFELVNVTEVPPQFEVALRRVGTPQSEVQHYRCLRVTAARKQLSLFATQLGGRVSRIRVVEGRTVEGLVALSSRKATQLIALGSHGKGRVRRVLLGSTTQAMLREARCDVLIVPP